jgi:hypothetical protein
MNKDLNELKDLIQDIQVIKTVQITREQLIAKLRELQITPGDFAYENYDQNKLGFGPIREIEQIGGEGGGSNWFSIKHMEKTNQYFKISGYYQSYSGTDFDSYEDCLREVSPKQKTITVYE